MLFSSALNPVASSSSHTLELLILLSALAGAFHVMAPDHWLPASVLGWQKGWRLRQLAFLVTAVYIFHILLGVLLYFVAASWLQRIRPDMLLSFSVLLVVSSAALRWLRFARIREVVGSGSQGVWGMLTVFSLVGPAESLIPVLLKSRALGQGYLLSLTAFTAGTFLAGGILVVSGRVLFNQPLWLPLSLQFANRPRAVISVVCGVALGLGLLFHIS